MEHRKSQLSNEVKKEICLYLDGELDRHAANRVLQQIEQCPDCKQYYTSQKAYKTAIADKVVRRACGEDLKDALRSRIRGL
jgi:anti-sigma factor RsiW